MAEETSEEQCDPLTNEARTKLRLLHLPFVIRREIRLLLLLDRGTVVDQERRWGPLWPDYNQRANGRVWYRFWKRVPVESFPHQCQTTDIYPHILRTCRNIYNEATPILYGKLEIAVPDFDFPKFGNFFVNRIGRTNARSHHVAAYRLGTPYSGANGDLDQDI